MRRAFVAFGGLVARALTLALPRAPLYQETSPSKCTAATAVVAAVHLDGTGRIGVREIMTQPAIGPGAQHTVRAVLELTEPRRRRERGAHSE